MGFLYLLTFSVVTKSDSLLRGFPRDQTVLTSKAGKPLKSKSFKTVRPHQLQKLLDSSPLQIENTLEQNVPFETFINNYLSYGQNK